MSSTKKVPAVKKATVKKPAEMKKLAEAKKPVATKKPTSTKKPVATPETSAEVPVVEVVAPVVEAPVAEVVEVVEAPVIEAPVAEGPPFPVNESVLDGIALTSVNGRILEFVVAYQKEHGTPINGKIVHEHFPDIPPERCGGALRDHWKYGKLDREECGKTARGGPAFHYTVAAPGTLSRKAEVEANAKPRKKKVVEECPLEAARVEGERIVAAVQEASKLTPVEEVVAPEVPALPSLDTLVTGLAEAFAAKFASALGQHLAPALDSVVRNIIEQVQPKLQSAQPEKPEKPAPVLKRKPVIGILGLQHAQIENIKRGFGEEFDLRFWKDGGKPKLKALGIVCERILVTRYNNHATTQFLTAQGAKWERVTGDMDALQSRLTELYMQAQEDQKEYHHA